MTAKSANGVAAIAAVTIVSNILEDTALSFKQKNAEYTKEKPKAIFALKFLLKVKNGKVGFNDFDKTTQDNIKKLVGDIESMLK